MDIELPRPVSSELKLQRRQRLSLHSKRTLEFYLFISPWLVIFFFLGLMPLILGLYLSFTNYTGFNFFNLKYIGFSNYKFIFNTYSGAFDALWRTFVITAIYVPLNLVIGLLLALLVNRNLKGVNFYRTIFYIPSVVPVVATGLMWRVIFANQGGLLDDLLHLFHLPTINWIGYRWSTTSLILMLLWGAGGGLMIYLAGLKSIPRSFYESASIDGASTIAKFFYITVPMMTPVIFFNLIISIIASLQIMVQPIILSGQTLVTAPIQPIYLYMVDAWLQIFAYQRFGYGLAMLWMLFAITIVLTLIIFRTSRFWVHYEAREE